MSESFIYEQSSRQLGDGRSPRRPPSAPAAGCATDILILLAGEAAPLSTAVIAKSIGASRSLVSRTLSELQSRRLVEKAPDKTYRLGPRVLELGAAYASTQGFGHTAHAMLNQLSRATAQTTNLTILVGLDVLYLMKHEGRDSVIGVSQVGSRLPASCTAVGKALLSCLEDDDIERLYASVTNLPRPTPHSVQSIEDLLRDVWATRDRGYAIERDETVVGRTCLAIAVSWPGVPSNRAALGVSMANAIYDDEAGAILPHLQVAATHLEKEADARLILEGPNDSSCTHIELTNGRPQRDGPTDRDGRTGGPALTGTINSRRDDAGSHG